MAGGQERVLRRRIRSVQSTRKITKAMELIAASRIVRAQARIAANRPYRVGMEKILRVTAAADPTAAKKLLGTPESPDPGRRPGHRGRPRACRLVQLGRAAGHGAPGGRARPQRRPGDAVDRRQEGAGVLPLPRDRDGALLRRHRRPARVRRRPRRGRRGHRPVRGRGDGPGADGVDPVHLGRQPAGRDAADAAPPAARRGRGRAAASRPAERRARSGTPSSSPSRRSCWPSWHPGRPNRRSSPPCSRARRRSSPPSSEPWRRRPTTPTSSSAP